MRVAQLLLLALLLVSFSIWTDLIAKAFPKELPMLVTVSDLVSEPGQYDGHRVVVNGHVRSIEIQRGRRGSLFVMLVLEEIVSNLPGLPSTVKVVSLSRPPVLRGNYALVQGVYHQEGRQVGRIFEHFIDAEVILREKL